MNLCRPASLCCVGLGIHLVLLAACIALSLQPSWLAAAGPVWLVPLAASAGLIQWRLMGISKDIRRRKEAQDYLQQTLRQLRQLSEHQRAESEDERRQVATGIHDELGQNLLALKIDVALLERRTAGHHPRLHLRVQQTMKTLDTTIGSVRTIINSLRPAILDCGIDAALEWQLDQFGRRTGIGCMLDVQAPLVPLDGNLTAAVFRIVQESLDNVARHAKASKVTVRLALSAGSLSLSIVDDGVGIADANNGAGFGLCGMRERVAALGGELRIDRGSGGGGTAISIQIPQPQPDRTQATNNYNSDNWRDSRSEKSIQ